VKSEKRESKIVNFDAIKDKKAIFFQPTAAQTKVLKIFQ
jgi:hypothetical protein